MNTPSQFQKRFIRLPRSLGFTLIELLLSTAIISSAAVIGGMGLSAIISSSTAVNESNERQDELNRALDFIAAEIRDARSVSVGVPPAPASSAEPYFNQSFPPSVDPSTVQPIMWLETDSGADIVYYVAENTVEGSDVWQGPKVVYRWGLQFDPQGEYDPTQTPQHQILIDSLSKQIQARHSIECPNGLDGLPLPKSVINSLGFYACVDDDSKMASLFQIGQVNKVLEKTESTLQTRKAYSRATETISSTPKILPSDPSPPDPTCVTAASCPPDDPNPIKTTPTGYEIIQELEELELKHMGGAITCGSGGPTIPTVVTVSFKRPNGNTTSIDLVQGSIKRTDVPTGTQISFRARRQSINNCGEFTVDTQFDLGTQIIALDDGQGIPYYEPFDNQNKIDQFLSDYLEDNKISIGVNEKVFLFEVGESYSSNPSSAYDFQDIVLKADMRPKKRVITTIINDPEFAQATTTTTITTTSGSGTQVRTTTTSSTEPINPN